MKDNWVNVCSGTGTLASLIVNVSINYEINKRQGKGYLMIKIVLRDIVDSSVDVYEGFVYRINEYVMFSNIPPKSLYN